ncbi:MAG: TIGR03905 family TSCPD domain-containing protein [Bacteroidaceae bacterium]|nr:TIGR03905 family TSCPD domain-containing protein [Bacteroidaceae bacterium]
MKQIIYNTIGTCSRQIIIDIDDNNVVQNCVFIGGCMGNTAGISALVKGMKAENIIERLKGIKCGMKPTSCPDQLSQALQDAIK